jgi:hypothetical protein
MDENQSSLLGYLPKFHTLARGWIYFNIRYKEDMTKILNRIWGWGAYGLVIKELAISFDPTRDPMTPTKVWASLPNLLIVLWEEVVMVSIGKKLGSFVSCEPYWQLKIDRRWV